MRVEVGEHYEHDVYGEVYVYDIQRSIDAVEDGDVDDRLVVRYFEGDYRDYSTNVLVPDGKEHHDDLDDFVQMLQGAHADE